jgi:Protein of unknown function (DUF1688)
VSERETALSLLSAEAVRERAHELLQQGIDGRLAHFFVDLDQLVWTADYVANVIRANYPTLHVPLHARWRHFVFAGRDLWTERKLAATWRDAAERARAAFDLAIVSVLLDAGAGPEWRYRDGATGISATRSEGLALASLRMFEAGLFSSYCSNPLRADAQRLSKLTEQELAAAFQASETNPLGGLGSRTALLRNLGKAANDSASVFAIRDTARPGGLFDWLTRVEKTIAAPDILRALLIQLGPIWPDRLSLAGIPLGDTWRHSAIRRDDASDGLMPLHKLSQWLSYSLIEPLQEPGFTVTGTDRLTGLAEYRNGGLMLDSRLLKLREPADMQTSWPVDSELVVEWRALTVALLDRLLPLVRKRLGVSERDFPLGAMLEGGSWAAGRKLAREKRASSAPPLTVVSDGTVF